MGSLNPPGIAHIPSYGAWPRRTSSTWSCSSTIVRMTTSTVTANAGNFDGSYPEGTSLRVVLVVMTETIPKG